MQQQNFLLGYACTIPKLPSRAWEYNDSLQMNFISNEDGGSTPVCSYNSIVTFSKTLSEPCDDDPDPDAELCY